MLALLFAGCASTPTDHLTAAHPEAQKQIQDRLREIFAAATQKDFPRLDSYHLYGPKFTRFATESPDREDAQAAREAEHRGLNAVSGMKTQLGNLKVDVFRDVGVATFILHYSFTVGNEIVARTAKGTLVLVNDRGNWKIVHEHFSSINPT